jgi:voltage-gated potassium channel
MRLKLISPDSKYKKIWDLIITVLALFIAIELPLRLSLDYTGLTNIILETSITIILFIDIFVNFNTKIYSKGYLIVNRKNIGRHYVHKLFFFDLFAAVPFYLIALIFPAIIWLKWLSLIRLFKLLRLNSVISKLLNRQSLNPSIFRLGVFFFWILLIAHWIACSWIFIARFEKFAEIPTYIDSIYWCITTLTTVGYGDISPVTDLQKILTMIAMIFGVILYGYVIGNIASLLANIDVVKTRFLKRTKDINSFLAYNSVPKRLRKKVQKYYQYIWDNRLDQFDQDIISDLPASLKSEIYLHLNRHLIEKVPFFKNTDKKFINEIILLLKPKIFLPGDYIFRKGDVGISMYFISKGSIDVLSDDESSVLANLNDGNYFGEIALIKEVSRTKTVIAKDYSNLYLLDKKNFDNLLKKYPNFKNHIYETIKKRQSKNKIK